MRTLDAVELVERCRYPRQSDKEWLEEHRDELDDLLYNHTKAIEESKRQGCMLGCWKENHGYSEL